MIELSQQDKKIFLLILELFDLSNAPRLAYDFKYFEKDLENSCHLIHEIQLYCPESLLQKITSYQSKNPKLQLAQNQINFITDKILPLMKETSNIFEKQKLFIQFSQQFGTYSQMQDFLKQNLSFPVKTLTRRHKSFNLLSLDQRSF